jgi:hypothetical protein
MSIKKKINFIYLLPAHKNPSGGSKTIYQHSELINKLNINGISSQVLHLKKKKTGKILQSLKKNIFKSPSKNYGWYFNEMKAAKFFIPSNSWIENKILLKNNVNFDPKKDFVIIPEIWAHFASQFFIRNKIKYAIFTQGVYAMNSFHEHNKLSESYNKAELILTISDDTSKCIKLIYPKCKDKIFKINVFVDNKKFNNIKKKNLITFMPRKLNDHCHILSLFLFKKLPKKWRIQSLNNLNEKDLFLKLSASKIFLSFSYLEGFGLPPLEAALAGNKVIGYTGEGGKEYWKKPIFEEIKSGEIKKFYEKIIYTAKNFPKDWNKKTSTQKRKLINKYSKGNQKKLVFKLIRKIKSVY